MNNGSKTPAKHCLSKEATERSADKEEVSKETTLKEADNLVGREKVSAVLEASEPEYQGKGRDTTEQSADKEEVLKETTHKEADQRKGKGKGPASESEGRSPDRDLTKALRGKRKCTASPSPISEAKKPKVTMAQSKKADDGNLTKTDLLECLGQLTQTLTNNLTDSLTMKMGEMINTKVGEAQGKNDQRFEGMEKGLTCVTDRLDDMVTSQREMATLIEGTQRKSESECHEGILRDITNDAEKKIMIMGCYINPISEEDVMELIKKTFNPTREALKTIKSPTSTD